MKKTGNEICLIAPTEQLAERALAIIEKENLPIAVSRGALDEAVAIAREWMDRGTWLFISRKGTKSILEKQLNTRVIGIQLEASDYIPAIEEARKVTGLIAFFSFEEISNEIKTICYLLGINMRCYHFNNNKSCKASVIQAARDGAVLGIGGVVSERFAREVGMEHIIVESSEASIHHTIELAFQMLKMHREEEKKQEEMQIRLERYENILNYTHDAIIAINSKGNIDVVNDVASSILAPNKTSYIGEPIEEVLPNTRLIDVLKSGKKDTDQLMNINGTQVSVNRIPIIVNDKVKGVVATFQDIKSLQHAEQNIRMKLHEKGLQAKYHFSDILGDSAAIHNAKKLAKSFSDSQFTIMLYGQTGTGKELFAQSIHNASPRRNGPFVAVNCTALSKSLLESELFGYSDSSFTGAKRGGKAGLFELAHGGTIFLDEIGELPIEIQAQFLRVLQEKEVRRVGGDSLIPVDIRIIGATNRNLMQRVEEGEFRRDLYYRLNVLNVTLPALHERGDDYLIIARAIFEWHVPDCEEEFKSQFIQILKRYQNYTWPGNVRELTNIVERITLLLSQKLEEELVLASLDLIVPEETNAEVMISSPNVTLQDAEQIKIKEALERNQGNLSRTAKELNISRSTLYRKLNK